MPVVITSLFMQFLLTLCNGRVYIKFEEKALKKPYNDDFYYIYIHLTALPTAVFRLMVLTTAKQSNVNYRNTCCQSEGTGVCQVFDDNAPHPSAL